MEMPNWNSMDQKQRIMAIGGAVVLIVAVALLARGMFGGGPKSTIDPSAITGIQSAVEDGTIKAAPPVEAPEDLEPIQRKGAVPSGG